VHTQQLRSGIASSFDKVMSAPDARVRRIHTRVTERMVIYMKYKMQRHADPEYLASLLELFNANLSCAVTQNETDFDNLLLIFDIIFNFVVRYQAYASNASALCENDCAYALFVQGRATVSVSLVRQLNISLFSHLFSRLPTRKSRHVRVALLMIIINKCQTKPADLSTLGISFFRTLINSRDPEIALNAAKFLLNQLEKTKPEAYRIIIARLLARAKEIGDDTVLANPFSMIKAMMKG
jgi:hypothetical protein